MAEVIKTATFRKGSQREAYENPRSNKISKLGQYLFTLARMADAMYCEADERFLRDNLYGDPPLHIRRTLNQSYFLTFKDTATQDKRQVVCRETREDRNFHTHNTR